MNLQDIKGQYHAIYSLGNNCLPAIQLRTHGLRKYAGPLDWMGSPMLPQVTRLLLRHFEGFLYYPNLTAIEKANPELYNVHDREYDLYLNHDFYTHNNFPPHLAAYPEIKEKYDRRISRFLQDINSGLPLMFIRTDAVYEEVVDLNKVLKHIVRGPYRLLIVNHTNVEVMTEQEWSLDNVAVVLMPDKEIWAGNNHWWMVMFNGVSL